MNTIIDISRTFPATYFFSGVIFATFTGSAIFYFKFWRKTREPFFLVFAMACWALALERLAMLLESEKGEVAAWVFSFRIVAFLLVSSGIYYANRRKTSRLPMGAMDPERV